MWLIFVIILIELHSAKPVMESKVVKGDRAKITKFAHSAFLMVASNKGTFVCGSSIISQRILLTAAHCIACNVECRKPVAYTGHTNKRQGDMIPIMRTVIHERYNRPKIANDIGLVLLKNNLQFGKTVKRIALMRKPPYTKLATIAGWGLVDEIRTVYTDHLHAAKQKVWSLTECQRMISIIPKGTFCAGDIKNQRYGSEGDSGSALVIKKYIQIGLVTFKRPDITRAIVVYTDVAYYYDWIKNNSRKLYCN